MIATPLFSGYPPCEVESVLPNYPQLLTISQKAVYFERTDFCTFLFLETEYEEKDIPKIDDTDWLHVIGEKIYYMMSTGKLETIDDDVEIQLSLF